MAEFVNDVVKFHNIVRKQHGVEELTLNDELTAHAQKWANQIAKSGKFAHSDCKFKGQSIGENIAMSWKSKGLDFPGKEACDMWYGEIKKYNFDKPGYTNGTGHFTQMVWKGSKEIGVGIARCADGKVYAVANYFPAGNFMGEFPENVLPKLS